MFLQRFKTLPNSFLFYLFSFIILLSEWYLFAYSAGISYPNAFGTFLKGIGDISIILIPYFIVPRKFRWINIFIAIIVSLFFLSNVLYFRFWNDLVPTSVYTTTANFDTDLFKYTAGLIIFSDIWFIISPLLISGSYLLLKPYKSSSFPFRYTVAGCLISIAIFSLGQFSYLKSGWGYKHETEGLSLKDFIKDHYTGDNSKYISRYSQVGLPVYMLRFTEEVIELKILSSSLSKDDLTRIKTYLEKINDKNAIDSTHSSKNIVLIITESLNSDVIGLKTGGINLTPTLDSLINQERTIYFNRVVSQTRHGGSSDGQMILLTGLLPIEKGAATVSFVNSTYPALPSLLKDYYSEVFLADDGVIWNQESSLKNYGFEKVHTIKDFEKEAKEMGKDAALFDYFLKKEPTLREPYFATLITMSMHVPFQDGHHKDDLIIEEASNLSKLETDYLKSVHYYDAALKKLVDSLDSNTLIIIASDHSQDLVSLTQNPYAVYLALNSDTTANINRIVGQANLFPVTLKLAGVNDTIYNGVAKTALSPEINYAIDGFGKKYGDISAGKIDSLLLEFKISDLIIRGNYFKFLSE